MTEAEYRSPSGSFRVTGAPLNILGIEVVIDHEFGDRLEPIKDGLVSSVETMHPRLRAATKQVVVPNCSDPSGFSAATAINATGQIFLWSNGRAFGAPSALPDLSVVLLEHEAAHLIFPTRGAPDATEWASAMNCDGFDDFGCPWVSEHIETAYDHGDRQVEDWAESVCKLLNADRTGDTWFRSRFPHRCELIDKALS